MSNIAIWAEQLLVKVKEIHDQNIQLYNVQEAYLKKEMQLRLEVEKLKQELHQAKVQSKKQDEKKTREEELKKSDINFQELLADHVKHQARKVDTGI